LGEGAEAAVCLPLAEGLLERLAQGFVLEAFREGDRQGVGREQRPNLLKGGMFLEPAGEDDAVACKSVDLVLADAGEGGWVGGVGDEFEAGKARSHNVDAARVGDDAEAAVLPVGGFCQVGLLGNESHAAEVVDGAELDDAAAVGGGGELGEDEIDLAGEEGVEAIAVVEGDELDGLAIAEEGFCELVGEVNFEAD